MAKKDFMQDLEQDTAGTFFDAPAKATKKPTPKAKTKDAPKTPAKASGQDQKKGLLPTKELKSVRKHISIQPSTYKGLEQLAKTNKTSFNEIVNALLKDGLERWGD